MNPINTIDRSNIWDKRAFSWRLGIINQINSGFSVLQLFMVKKNIPASSLNQKIKIKTNLQSCVYICESNHSCSANIAWCNTVNSESNILISHNWAVSTHGCMKYHTKADGPDSFCFYTSAVKLVKAQTRSSPNIFTLHDNRFHLLCILVRKGSFLSLFIGH